jgi:hypothetical protein
VSKKSVQDIILRWISVLKNPIVEIKISIHGNSVEIFQRFSRKNGLPEKINGIFNGHMFIS